MKTKYTLEILGPLVKDSFSIAEVVEKLGLQKTGGNHSHISKIIKYQKLDTSHFLGQASNRNKCPVNKHTKKSLRQAVFIKNGSYVTGSKLRYYLIEIEGIPNICNNCKIGPIWNDKLLILEVDHKNGDHFDNRLKNLQLLCPNCHSQKTLR